MTSLRTATVLILLAAVGFGAWRWNGDRSRTRARAQSKPAPTAVARKMDFDTILLATGALQPGGSHPLVAPPQSQGESKVEYIVADGAPVKAGEVVVKLTTRELQENLDRTMDGLQQAKDKLEQTTTSGERQVEGARSGVATAEQKLELTTAQAAADVERAQAELDQARSEKEYAQEQLAKMQRLFDQGLATREKLDQETNGEKTQVFAFEEAERALANGRREAEEKTRAATTERDRSKLDLADAENKHQRAVEAARNSIRGLERQVAQLELAISQATLRTDRDGVALLNPTWDESGQHTFRVGDQVWQGRQIGQVIDPKHLRVSCEIDEIDMRRVRAGQRVRLRVGTAREQVFPGHLENVNSIATDAPWWRGGSPGRKSFSAWVALDRAGPALRPGTTAWLEIQVDAVKGKLAVPLQAIFQERGKTVVFRRRGSRFREVPVKLGARNEFYCAVLAGLTQGDEVALARPSPDTVGAGLPTGPRAGTEPRPYDGPRTRRRP